MPFFNIIAIDAILFPWFVNLYYLIAMCVLFIHTLSFLEHCHFYYYVIVLWFILFFIFP